MPLGFNLYCSVSPDEMQALQRVVDAARELCLVSSDPRDAAGACGLRPDLRNLPTTDLAVALSVLDGVRMRRNRSDGRGGTLEPS